MWLLAPRLGVSVHWLEIGYDDSAAGLAQLVLGTDDTSLPARPRTLARRILRDHR